MLFIYLNVCLALSYMRETRPVETTALRRNCENSVGTLKLQTLDFPEQHVKSTFPGDGDETVWLQQERAVLCSAGLETDLQTVSTVCSYTFIFLSNFSSLHEWIIVVIFQCVNLVLTAPDSCLCFPLGQTSASVSRLTRCATASRHRGLVPLNKMLPGEVNSGDAALLLHLPLTSPLPIPWWGSLFTVKIGRGYGIWRLCRGGEEVMPSSLHGAASDMNI